jgi:hypothetical protein
LSNQSSALPEAWHAARQLDLRVELATATEQRVLDEERGARPMEIGPIHEICGVDLVGVSRRLCRMNSGKKYAPSE